jgi:hypothetical protein
VEPSDEDDPERPPRPQAEEHHRTDQHRSETHPATTGGRHRRAPRRPRLTAKQAADLIRCMPAVIAMTNEVEKHETPIRELLHTLTGVAHEIIDAVHGWIS